MALPNEYIWALVCGLPEPVRSKRRLFMLTAFIDDSDMGGEGPAAVLAGWVAPASVWAAFVDDWQKQVLDVPLPPIGLFKPNTWTLSSDSENARLNAALALIEKHALQGAIILVPHGVYKDVFPPSSTHSQLRNPYFVALFALVLRIAARACAAGETDRVNFYFDHQPGHVRAIHEAWELLLAMATPDVEPMLSKAPNFLPDDKEYGLQAAHLLAWSARRMAADICAGKTAFQFPWPPSIQCFHHVCTREDLELIARNPALAAAG